MQAVHTYKGKPAWLWQPAGSQSGAGRDLAARSGHRAARRRGGARIAAAVLGAADAGGT